MKEVIVSLLVLNVAFSSAAFSRQRLRRRSSITNSSEVEPKIDIEQFNFTQKLDHFNFENNQKWDQVRLPIYFHITSYHTINGD